MICGWTNLKFQYPAEVVSEKNQLQKKTYFKDVSLCMKLELRTKAINTAVNLFLCPQGKNLCDDANILNSLKMKTYEQQTSLKHFLENLSFDKSYQPQWRMPVKVLTILISLFHLEANAFLCFYFVNTLNMFLIMVTEH